jgi:flagellar hook-associated protein 2
MSFTPLSFTGVSQFSADFQTIAERAVKIAQLPITALQNRDADTIQKKGLLSGFSSGVVNLAASLEALGETVQNRALRASSTRPSVVTAQASGATVATSYVINSVTSIASAASERSLVGKPDSNVATVGTTGAFKLKVGTDEFDFTPTSNTLIGLRDKINTLGAGVTASILTTNGGNFLSVSANGSGAKTLELIDDPAGVNTNLLTNTNQGSDLVLHLNGIEVRQTRNLVNSVVPGLNFTVLAATNEATTLTLATDRNDLASALASFANGFNQLRGQVNAQVGEAAGLLTGNAVVGQLNGLLRQIGAHRTASGSVKGLADIGLTFDSKGALTFDEDVLNGMTDTQVGDAFTLLSSSGTGLAGFASKLRQFSDPVSGLIKLEQQGLDRVDLALQKQIAAMQDRLEVMQKGLARRLQVADSLLANLESQQNSVKASLQGLSSVLYGKQS